MNSQSRILGLGKRCQIPYSQHGLLLNLMTFHVRLTPAISLIPGYDLRLRLSEVAEVFHLPRPLYDCYI